MPVSPGLGAVGAPSRAQKERVDWCGPGLVGLFEQATEEQPPGTGAAPLEPVELRQVGRVVHVSSQPSGLDRSHEPQYMVYG